MGLHGSGSVGVQHVLEVAEPLHRKAYLCHLGPQPAEPRAGHDRGNLGLSARPQAAANPQPTNGKGSWSLNCGFVDASIQLLI